MPHLAFQQVGGLEEPSITFPVLVITLALSAFILWRRYRSRRQLVERITELETLSSAGRAIVSSQLDIDALCRLIAVEAGKVIDNSTFQIGLFEGRVYRIRYWSVDSVQRSGPMKFDLGDNGGLVGWIRESKHALLVRDFDKELGSLPARPRYISDNPPRSAIFIPLVSGSEAIGVMAAQSQEPNAFSERDQGHLTILANQAAAAIANAQIYHQVRTRAAHLELVSQIAQQVNAINDLEELLEQFVTLTRDTFQFGSVNVFGIDPESGGAVLQASSMTEAKPGSLRLAPGAGLIGTAATTRSPALSNNTPEDPRFVVGPLAATTKSEIAIPLIVDEELLGVLDVQSQDPEAFDQQEQTVLEALAAQVAIAIHKAQQFARQREQTWVTTAQLQVAEAISQSPDLESLTQTVVRLTPLLVGVDLSAILLRDEGASTYRGSAAFGLPNYDDVAFQHVSVPDGSWKALDAVHVGKEKLSTFHYPQWMTEEKPGPGSTKDPLMLLPLVAQGRMLGVMVVRSGQESKQDAGGHRGELLRSIANMAAQAIDSIELQAAQQEEAWVNTALLQVAEAVNKLTDLNEILHTIVRLVPMLVGVKTSLILIWDEELQAYRAGPSHGLSEMGQGLLESFEVDMSEFPQVEMQDVERVGPDAAYYTLRLPQWMDDILESETADLFPLYARARLVGALVVGPTASGRPLTGRRLNIVTGIAQQAAVAVVNDQLYRESAERSRMEQELSVARSIQASLIPTGQPDIPGCTVSGYWQAARRVSGDFYDFMSLSDGNWGIAIADVADKGVPAALFMALSRTILRTVAFNRRNPAATLERSNRLIYGDTSSDLFVTVFYAIWDPESRNLRYANGGHNPPVLIRSNGVVSMLESDGIALGVLENIQIDEKKVRLSPGDVVVFYTDGVTEAMNEDFDEFGLERLCMATQAARSGSASDVVDAITAAIDDHTGSSAQFDDITLVVMKC